MAIAVYANGSAIPLAYSAWGPHLSIAQPLAYAAAPAHYHTKVVPPAAVNLVESPASWAAPHTYAASPLAYSAPIAYAAPSAHVYHAAPVAVVAPAPEGQYVAANRGSVHVAPLPGHVASVSSSNLDAAPGTW